MCPGYINTQLSLNALSADGSKHGGMPNDRVSSLYHLISNLSPSLLPPVTDPTTARGMNPEYVAQRILQCIADGGRSLVLTTPTHHLALYLSFFWPSLLDWILQKRAKIT